MDKRGFGYDGFSDKITTYGRSHLSLLRESYHKNDRKRKITVVNQKVSFTAGFCLFFFFWLLSFLLFLASVLSAFCQISLGGNYFSSCFVIFFCFVFHPYQVFVFLFFYLSLFFMFHLHLFSSIYLFMLHLHQNIKNRIIHSCLLYLVLQWILGWILGFLLLYIYPFL